MSEKLYIVRKRIMVGKGQIVMPGDTVDLSSLDVKELKQLEEYDIITPTKQIRIAKPNETTDDDKPLEQMSKTELIAKARELGLEFSEMASNELLRDLIIGAIDRDNNAP